MRRIPVELYTCGNSKYLLVDELAAPYFNEHDKSAFAAEASQTFNAQCVLFIQSLERRVLGEINQIRQYWGHLPCLSTAPFAAILARSFDSDGQEQNASPSALEITQQYFEERYQFAPPILIDIPTATPSLRHGQEHGNDSAAQLVFRGYYTNNLPDYQFPLTLPQGEQYPATAQHDLQHELPTIGNSADLAALAG